MQFITKCVIPLISTILVAIFITGCASTASKYTDQPAVPLGSRVQLNITADIPLDSRKIYIQNGMILSKASIDTYSTYCSVNMIQYQDKNAAQMRIKPGEFTVSRVRLYNDYVFDPILYANNDDRYYYPSNGVNYRTELHLKSGDQPDVSSLNCVNRKEDYVRLGHYAGHYPVKSEFKAALQDLVNFL